MFPTGITDGWNRLATWFSAIALASVMLLMATTVAGQPILLDEFNDGDIETNSAPGGRGDGFDFRQFAGGSVIEANSLATLTSEASTASVSAIASKDLFLADGAVIVWHVDSSTGGNASGGAPGFRVSTQLRRDLDEFNDDFILFDFWGPNSGLFPNEFRMVANDGTMDVTYESGMAHNVDWNRDFEVRASISHSGYLVGWNDGAFGVGQVTGVWDSQPGFNFADFTDAVGRTRVGAFTQGLEGGGISILALDHISVLPEPPPSVLLAILCVVIVVYTRRSSDRCTSPPDSVASSTIGPPSAGPDATPDRRYSTHGNHPEKRSCRKFWGAR